MKWVLATPIGTPNLVEREGSISHASSYAVWSLDRRHRSGALRRRAWLGL